MLRIVTVYIALTLCGAMAVGQADAASQRTFVASYGLDSNTSLNCGLTTPCRTFGAAASVTNSAGEIIVLDSAGYGPVTITQSLSITAPPGIYAGISVFSGAGVLIATSGINVKLSGLTVNGQGGGAGIALTNGVILTIDNCTISNFSATNDTGIYVNANTSLTVTNTRVMNNYIGIYLDGGATGEISHSLIFGNTDYGIFVNGTTTNGLGTGAVIEDSEVSQNNIGVSASSSVASSQAKIAIVRSQIFTNIYGVVSQSTAGISFLTMTASFLMGNTYGLYQLPNGGTAILESFADNSAEFDGVPLTGTLNTKSHF